MDKKLKVTVIDGVLIIVWNNGLSQYNITIPDTLEQLAVKLSTAGEELQKSAKE